MHARTPLVKIDHVCFCYLTSTTNSASALLTITHKKRVLLKMASCKAVGSRFSRVSEDEINQIVVNAMSKSIKSQTNWSTGIFKGK